MIQNIVEDQIQNNSEITAQPIIWHEKHVEIDQAEESVTDDDDDDSLSKIGVEWQKRSPIDSVTVAPPRIAYEEVEAEEEFEEEFDEDDFEMIQDIFEAQIKNNSAITAQPIIWREKMLKLSKLKNL